MTLKTMREAQQAEALRDNSARLASVFDKIDGLGRLESNWDSYGGLPLAQKARDAGRSFLQRLYLHTKRSGEEFPVPWVVVPVPNGGYNSSGEHRVTRSKRRFLRRADSTTLLAKAA